jgi:uncharacterized protein YgbK (DUF1537 family)
MAQALLGCIADDFTGATDLANMLVRGGMRTVQTIGVPDSDARIEADALVVALKSRTVPRKQAVRQSLDALEWLRAQGCRQFFFKYCSTFDSTNRGNIGPVADALLDALKGEFTIACPAFPENGRTIFRGNLFVGDVLLNESGMENHPLTPMSDANLVRVLQRQTKSRVDLLRYDIIAKGAEAVRARIEELKEDGVRIAIADALTDADLYTIGRACRDLSLVTGRGSRSGCRRTFIRQICWCMRAMPPTFLASMAGRSYLPEAHRRRLMRRWPSGAQRGRAFASIRLRCLAANRWSSVLSNSRAAMKRRY